MESTDSSTEHTTGGSRVGEELATQQGGGVPALAFDGSTTLIAEDLALPRLYIGQAISDAVQDGLVSTGDLFVAQGGDDPDPTILAPKGSTDGVILHVLALRKGKSRSIDGVLETWPYDDPTNPAPPDAWTTYSYAIAIPSYDTEIPCKWLLTRTGRPAAQKINTVIARLNGEAPFTVAFRVTTVERSNNKGRYFVPRVTPVEASDEDVEVAAKLYTSLGDSFAATQTAQAQTDEPAI